MKLPDLEGKTYDGHGYSIPYNVFLSVLQDFGISATPGSEGRTEFTLGLQSPSTPEVTQAVFDPSSKQWRSWDAQKVGSVVEDRLDSSVFAVSYSRDKLKLQQSQDINATDVNLTLAGDWTDELPRTDHVHFLKSTDWGQTPLGPMSQWPPSLRVATHILLVYPACAVLYWGEDRVMMYNEHAVAWLSSGYPFGMGAVYRDALPDTYRSVNPIFQSCEESRGSIQLSDVEVVLHRKGFPEETWSDNSFVPIFSPEIQRVGGIYVLLSETSRLKFTDRRTKLLGQLAASPGLSHTSVWQHILESLRTLERDVPFAVLYSAEESTLNPCTLQLEGTLGVPRGHVAAPETIELHGNALDGFMPGLRQARSRGVPILLKTRDDALPPFLADGIHWRGFQQPSHTIVGVPLTTNGQTAGFMIIGTNPLLEYDEDYQHFIEELGRLSSAALSSSIGFEAAKAREAKLYKELTETEKFIRRVADVTPVGLYVLSPSGLLTWANSKFFEIAGLSPRAEDNFNLSFMECVHDDHITKVHEEWMDAISRTSPTATELKLKRRWKPPFNDGDPSSGEENAWILSTYAPGFDSGEITDVTGCITDISKLKWAERIHAQAAATAREAKRMQEKFIDVTSHEMRNPLSAIMQCADGITTSIESLKSPLAASESPSESLENISESAQTILLCASHQKRIVDDILTVSKLDSTLLTVFSTLTRPEDVVKEAFQMFKAELAVYKIKQSITVEPSFHQLGAESVYCDPARLSQICVNLLTNAMKFTKTASTRKISIRIGASLLVPPKGVSGDPQWFPTNQQRKSCVDTSHGPVVYLTFAVQDTGRGITAEEMTRLFSRFAQANAKTHIQYGGSGLGLFISRELTELMGGMIGASSVPDEGSTFAFFVKAQKPDPAQSSNLRMQEAAMNPSNNAAIGRATPRTNNSIILLVEDNLVNQKVLSKQLRRLGAMVHIANHGVEALSFIRTTRYWRANGGDGAELTVILMDWEMPVMDGLTCTREIRQMEADGLLTSHLTIVAVTANARAEQLEMAYAAGVDDLVTKPFKVSALMQKIEQL